MPIVSSASRQADSAWERHNVRPPYVSWQTFLSRIFRWEQGEHVTILGPTGSGKTTLELALLPLRTFVIVFGTKVIDPTLVKLEAQGYRRIETLDDLKYDEKRLLLWPRSKGLAEDRSRQRTIFHNAMDKVYTQGGWCLVIDEYQYLVEELRLSQDIKTILHQGRSNKITVVGGSQRASWIPIAAYANATHMFLRATPDSNDMKRLAGFGGANASAVKDDLYSLGRYEWLYLNTITGVRVRTRVDRG